MVVAHSYQILLPKIDFWPFSHWNSHWSPKNLRTAEGMVVERKQKLFWNQWTKWNILKPCRSWRNQIFSIRITLPPQPALSSFLLQVGNGQPPSLAEWGRGGLTPGVSLKKDQIHSRWCFYWIKWHHMRWCFISYHRFSHWESSCSR